MVWVQQQLLLEVAAITTTAFEMIIFAIPLNDVRTKSIQPLLLRRFQRGWALLTARHTLKQRLHQQRR